MPKDAHQHRQHYISAGQKTEGIQSQVPSMGHPTSTRRDQAEAKCRHQGHRSHPEVRQSRSIQTRRATGIQPRGRTYSAAYTNKSQGHRKSLPAHVHQPQHPQGQVSFLVHQERPRQDHDHIPNRHRATRSHLVSRRKSS